MIKQEGLVMVSLIPRKLWNGYYHVSSDSQLIEYPYKFFYRPPQLHFQISIKEKRNSPFIDEDTDTQSLPMPVK